MSDPIAREAGGESRSPAAHYRPPDWFTRNVMNPLVKALTRAGLSVWGSRVLEHRGRSTGQLHSTPVNLLSLEGRQYLVAPRGETQWVRNVRAAGGRLTLIKGRRRRELTAVEIAPPESVDVLRAYLKRWKFEVGQFFDGAGDDEIAAIAGRHPVFVLVGGPG